MINPDTKTLGLERKAIESGIPDSTVLAQINSIDGSQWLLECHDYQRSSQQYQSLTKLIKNSCGENPFYEPAFLAAARNRVIRNKIKFLTVWECLGEYKNIRLAIPVHFISKKLSTPEHMTAVSNEYAPLGNPLVDKDDIKETLDRFCSLLQIAFNDGLPPLLIENVSSSSRFLNTLQNNSAHDLDTVLIEPHHVRTALLSTSTKDFSSRLSSKRNREINRLGKKLKKHGVISWERVSNPLDLVLRFEEFLLLEAKSWKGDRGTSMQTLKKTAAFARQSVIEMSKIGKSEIFTLRLDDKAIASTIVFNSAGNYYPWKTAFDAAYSKCSPGMLLMDAISKEIYERDDFKFADSLAHAGRSWMSLIWPDELELSTIILAGNNKDAVELRNSMKLYENLKTMVKKSIGRT